MRIHCEQQRKGNKESFKENLTKEVSGFEDTVSFEQNDFSSSHLFFKTKRKTCCSDDLKQNQTDHHLLLHH